MQFAILAAGKGERLQSEGAKIPKPLIEIKEGESLLARLMRLFVNNRATEIHVVLNRQQPQTYAFLQQKAKELTAVKLNIVVQDTPSSMHSLYALKGNIKKEKCIVTTVDTLMNEESFANYCTQWAEEKEGCLMGVTSYIDDEKPLYVKVDNTMTIKGFFDESNTSTFISAGVYGLTSEALSILDKCIEKGESRMRNFQRALVKEGLLLKAFDLGKVIDIDHVSDIAKAKTFLKRVDTYGKKRNRRDIK